MLDASLTGAYYWVPRPISGGMTWDLVTCHDLNVWDADFAQGVLARRARTPGDDMGQGP